MVTEPAEPVGDSRPRILVVFDGSTLSERALVHALELGGGGADVTILMVIPPHLWRGKQAQFQVPPGQRDEAFAREQIARAKQLCRARGARVKARLRRGPPAEVIVDEASHGYDVLCLGEREPRGGAKTFGDVVRGRVTCEVVTVR